MQQMQQMQMGPMGGMGFDAEKAFAAERQALSVVSRRTVRLAGRLGE